MTIDLEIAPNLRENKLDQETYTGAGVTIHAPAGPPIADRADSLLRAAERILEYLKKVLMPDDERSDAHLNIFVDRPREGEHLSSTTGPQEAIERVGDGSRDSFLVEIHPNITESAYAVVITRGVISKWFGA